MSGPGIRRHLTTLLLGALVGAGLIAVSPVADACACGGVVHSPESTVSVGSETSIVRRQGGTESITMHLAMRSDTRDVGLLVPTPHPAKVSLGDSTDFDVLASASAPRQETRWHLFGPPALFGSHDNGASSGAPHVGSGHVHALSTVDLGPLRATTLQADDPDALQAWLTAHRYRMRPDLSQAVAPYVAEGWSFVAIRLTQEGHDLNGKLPPLVMTFPSRQIVYPMRMSRAADHDQSVRVYVLARHRVHRTDASARGSSTPQVMYAGRVHTAYPKSAGLKKQLRTTPYLTTIDQDFNDPRHQVVSDLTFTRSDSDAGYQRVEWRDDYRIPVDVAVIGILLVIGLAGLVAWRVRSRRAAKVTP